MVNPLKDKQRPLGDRPVPPSDPQERVQFWIARGNAYLAEIGRHDVRWVHHNGHYSIESVR